MAAYGQEAWCSLPSSASLPWPNPGRNWGGFSQGITLHLTPQPLYLEEHFLIQKSLVLGRGELPRAPSHPHLTNNALIPFCGGGYLGDSGLLGFGHGQTEEKTINKPTGERLERLWSGVHHPASHSA